MSFHDTPNITQHAFPLLNNFLLFLNVPTLVIAYRAQFLSNTPKSTLKICIELR